MMEPTANWQIVNQRLMARTLAECAWEGLLKPVRDGSTLSGAGRYRLDTGAHTYHFEARRTPWDYLRIRPESIRRDGFPFHDAIQMVLDCQAAFAMTDITLGNFIEELNSTLAGDLLRQQTLGRMSAAQLLELPATRLEGLLGGHPKVLANRGRLGWGQEALHKYSPEAGQPLHLRWLAAHRATGIRTCGDPAPEQCLTPAESEHLAPYLHSADWQLLPVHPWQWQQFIQTQYAPMLQAGTLVDLGESGESYLPQQSIRTLSNLDEPERCDLKLSLTILNTSCYRGIPPEPMALAPALSRWLEDVAQWDSLLAEKGLTVQRELGGLHLPHPHQQQVTGTPYRYREMLGAVWRQSLAGKLNEGEQGWIFAVLMQCDGAGRPLVAEMVRRSDWPVERWLTQLFERVTLPLYHLLCRYGVGLVAHGQNLGVIFRQYRPQRVVIKDFHGDLRLEDGGCPIQAGVPAALADQLPRLPAAHLLHDLYTGHLVTGLRFLSPLLEEALGFPEARFYQLLYQCLSRYQRQHPELAPAFARFDLLRPTMERVCLNRVRFRMGYGDDAARPTPALGPELPNPLNPCYHQTPEICHE
ncbi:IucA/IucC family protein [Marinobacter sp.]|uniref:IucA/IucC family protein n=1 Tax=Marinobacter sp. TaxID=50741 RepID=UPI00356923E1